MRIRAIDIERTTSCWACSVTFMVRTAEQFTDEEHTTKIGGKHILTSLAKGLWKARTVSRLLRAKPGEREAKGWSA